MSNITFALRFSRIKKWIQYGAETVFARQPGGSVVQVTPMAVGDLDDNDNNRELCLDVEGEPLRVFFPAGFLTDPNEDLNPDTEIAVSPVFRD